MKNKKKSLILIVSLFLVLIVAGAGILLWNIYGKNAQTGNKANVDWYDETATEFTISTVEELYGLAKLSEYYSFEGKTVKLGADIIVNKGNAQDWSEKAPELKWYPIEKFAGVFDGQGFSISGLYGNNYLSSMGLFTETQKSCVIRNVSVVNSYFQSNSYAGTGAIVGCGGGTIDTVYSDAIIEGDSRNFGGLVGRFTESGMNTITNSWFDGVINMESKYASHVGGVLGGVDVLGASNTVEHCLSTATITSTSANVGGLCGAIDDGSALDILDCLSLGSITFTGSGTAGVGSVLGRANGKAASAFIEDTYAARESYTTRVGGGSTGTVTGTGIPRHIEMLKGNGGYQWTSLDFDGYWAMQEDSTPMLKSFAEADCDVTGLEKMFDTSWFDEDMIEFTIRTKEQFYGFAQLTLTHNFAGQTIRLGADIVLNEGDAKDWATTAPENVWIPIGWSGSGTSQQFVGTFDGQGHTISGVYAKQDSGYVGLFAEVYKTGTVKNLRLTNSYFECTMASTKEGYVGSIVGRGLGTIDTVYSDAIVVNSSKFTGGISGYITADGSNKITNCWFDGTIYGAINTGGILGGVHGAGAGIEATIEHCLNTGDITISDGMSQVGGICGVVRQASTLYLTDCLNAGTLTLQGTVKIYGAGIGYVAQDSKGTSYAYIKDSYGVKDFYTLGIGLAHGELSGVVLTQTKEKLTGYSGYQWTTLNFKDYWSVSLKGTPILKSFAAKSPSVANVERKVDISWYSQDKTSMTITTPAQLYGFAMLSNATNFEGQTIKLGADITVNQGNAKDWAVNPPADVWTPIGWSGSKTAEQFIGTFDGQGHTISGLYAKQETPYVGLFAEIYKKGTVKNLRLTNSYFECTIAKDKDGMVGSIAGRNLGVIDTVYSDAIVVNSGKVTGGLAGLMIADGANKITNSWFAGEIQAGINTGGILGGVDGNKQGIKATIEHCLNTGKIIISDGASQVGGLCGIVRNDSTLYLQDSLNTGTFEGKGAYKNIGTAIGYVAKDSGGISKAVLDHVYGVKEFSNTGVGVCLGTTEGTALVLRKDVLKGQGGYHWTELNYNDFWMTANQASTPILQSFGGNDKMDMKGVSRIVWKWSGENGTEAVINNVDELYLFAMMSETETFEGKTIKLGADITLNKGAGTVADWKTNNFAGLTEWIPIGYRGSSSGKNFKGTFDGQGHTISGIYVNDSEGVGYVGLFGEIHATGVVKDLKLENSYFASQCTNAPAYVGSIAGRFMGKLEKVKSSAVVESAGQYTGGLVGGIAYTSAEGAMYTITNCQFAGNVSGTYKVGGILGGVYGTTALTAKMEHCLNTGTIYSTNGQAGGLCGGVFNDTTLEIKDSLNTGLYDYEREGAHIEKEIASAVGVVGSKATLKVTNGYAIKDTTWKKENGTISGACGASGIKLIESADLKGKAGYLWTQLDYKDYWMTKDEESTPELIVFGGSEKLPMTGVPRANTDWYTPGGVSTIYTVDDLYGFAMLSETTTFEGDTILLDKTLTVNSGTVAEWRQKEFAGLLEWEPIGYRGAAGGKNFKGTFDGQGNTINGLYVNDAEGVGYVGLFGEIHATGVVKDLKLENSYFTSQCKNTEAYVGSIAGRFMGKLEKVKSSAVVESAGQYTGGLVGGIAFTAATNNPAYKISNCQFAGSVSGTYKVGGILGGVYGKTALTAKMEHCHNTGTIYSTNGQAGGLCGGVFNDTTLEIKDSLNTGLYDYEREGAYKEKYIASGVGQVGSKATLKVTNGYAIKNDTWKKEDGTISGACDASGIELRSLEQLTGKAGYYKTLLDYENYWMTKDEESTPTLIAFGGTDKLDMPGNIDWYDPEAKESTIYTVDDLYGFVRLSSVYEFTNQTIKLNETLTINEGTVAKWKEKDFEGLLEWLPIGYRGSAGGKNFKGTFDGQGNTINGLYVNDAEGVGYVGLFGEIHATGVVKDLKLENSYFTSQCKNTEAYVGSIAGRFMGKLEKVKSSAVVESVGQYTGGLVGGIAYTSAEGAMYTITNCQFAGSVSGTYKVGGILGGVYGKTALTAKMEHCHNTGTIYSTNGQAGGLCGGVFNDTTLEIKDSLNTGLYDYEREGAHIEKEIASAVGVVGSKATLKVTNGYAIKDTTWKKENGTISGACGASGIKLVEPENLKGTAGYQNTALDYEDYWMTKDENSTPELIAFGGTEKLNVTGTPRVGWYTEGAVSTIHSVDDLFGFALLSKTRTFAGDTILLGKTLTVNSGTVAKWEENEFDGLREWTPIGYRGGAGAKNFKGTFDGQGNTINGLYVNDTEKVGYVGLFGEIHSTGVVKNLIVANSYFKSDSTSNPAYVGSVAGRFSGTLDTVYSSAEVVSAGQYSGGLIGGVAFTAATNNPAYKISNCQFAGTLTGTANKIGGILGGVYGGGSSNKQALTVIMEHCLNTGTIYSSAAQVGGLCGAVLYSTTLNISDSVNIGTYGGTSTNNVGSAIGIISGAYANASNVYTCSDDWPNSKVPNGSFSSNSTITALTVAEFKESNGKGAANLTYYADGQDSSSDGDDKTCWWIARNGNTPVLESFKDVK